MTILVTSLHFFISSYQVEKPFGFKIDSNMRAHFINHSYVTTDFEKLEMSKIAPQVVDSINDNNGKV